MQRDWPAGTTTCALAPGSGTNGSERVIVGELSVLTMLVCSGPQVYVLRFEAG